MEETEELTHQRAQREVRALFKIFTLLRCETEKQQIITSEKLEPEDVQGEINDQNTCSKTVACMCVQELERLNQVLEEEKMKFEEVVLELKAEQEHIKL